MLQSYNDILLPPSFEKMPSSATCHMSPLDKKRGTRNSLSQPRWIGTMPPSAICWFLHRNGMGRVGILVPRGRQQPGITNTLGQDNPLSSKFGIKYYFSALAEQPHNPVVLFSWSSHLPLFQILYGYVIYQAVLEQSSVSL